MTIAEKGVVAVTTPGCIVTWRTTRTRFRIRILYIVASPSVRTRQNSGADQVNLILEAHQEGDIYLGEEN